MYILTTTISSTLRCSITDGRNEPLKDVNPATLKPCPNMVLGTYRIHMYLPMSYRVRMISAYMCTHMHVGTPWIERSCR